MLWLQKRLFNGYTRRGYYLESTTAIFFKMVNLDEFNKLDIRIGKVLTVEKVAGTDRLLKFTVDLGEEKRQIISGIADYYPDYEKLIGKLIPIVVNLEPKKIRGQLSEGMILLVDAEKKPVFLSPDEKVVLGSKVR